MTLVVHDNYVPEVEAEVHKETEAKQAKDAKQLAELQDLLKEVGSCIPVPRQFVVCETSVVWKGRSGPGQASRACDQQSSQSYRPDASK